MARRCPITQKTTAFGNNVSHANNKTRRRFLPNMQQASFMSDALGRMVHLRLSTTGIRTIEFHGGIDAYLQRTSATKLNSELSQLKKVLSSRSLAHQAK